jgi:hypothetical protein
MPIYLVLVIKRVFLFGGAEHSKPPPKGAPYTLRRAIANYLRQTGRDFPVRITDHITFPLLGLRGKSCSQYRQSRSIGVERIDHKFVKKSSNILV